MLKIKYFNFDYKEYGQVNNAKTGDIHSYYLGQPFKNAKGYQNTIIKLLKTNAINQTWWIS